MVILVPCKPLAHGKSRLAGCLSPRARRALCEFFLCRTLDVATAAAGAARVRVVTGDPAVAAIAADYGVAAIADGGADLNGALERGRTAMLAKEGAGAALILPIDLPLATPAALRRIMAARGETVIVPDEAGEGTNVLRLAPAALRSFRFAFGPRSFAEHRTQARALGHAPRTVRDRCLMFDVDGPDEYRRWIAM
jgi:2-phospho-L-lactate guanylyltransferase